MGCGGVVNCAWQAHNRLTLISVINVKVNLLMLLKLTGLVRRNATSKALLLLFIVYMIVFGIFFYADVPFGLSAMRQYAGEVKILDTLTFYDVAQAYALLDSLGPQGRAIYARILTMDMLYPAVLGAFVAVVLAFMLQKILPAKSYWYWLSLLPIANAVLDYGENAMTWLLLGNYPNRLNAVATVGGYLTLLKSLMGMLSFVALGLVSITWLLQALRRKTTL